MGQKGFITSILVLAVAIRTEAQFFDFFSDLRPFTYQTVKPIFPFQESTTKKTKTTYQRHNGEEQHRTPSYNEDREGNRANAREKARRRTTTTSYDVTQRPRVKNATRSDFSNSNNKNSDYSNSNNNRNRNNNGNYNVNQGNRDSNNDYNNRPWQDANVIEYTTRPRETTRNNKYTTYNPLYNRPGVKPALVDNSRPPITNRPATQRPFAVYPRPTDGSVIRFPEGADTSPPVLTGTDVDSMSQAEKRKYLQIAEKMCDKYKSLSVKKLEFIPLLPSPESVQINVTECEVSSVPLVVGGKVTSIREFPHMALLGWTKLKDGGYAWKCGGSLVSDRYVLSAAHCSFQNRDADVASGAPRVVQLGSTYLDDTGALVVRVSSVIRHPKYSQSRSYYDIALVKMAKSVTFSAVVKPACLGVPPPVGEMVVATGWGRTEFGGDQSLELRSVSVPIWDMQDCRRILGVTRKMPEGPSPESQLCAGEKKGGKDTCQGDSGGPAQIKDGCLWRIIGVTSVGRSCGAVNTPAIYARVFREFIAAQIFGDKINDIDNKDYESNHDSGASNQNNGFNNHNSEVSNQDYGYNNHNSDRQNVGSNSNWQNNDNMQPNYDRNQYSDFNNNPSRQSFNNFDNDNRRRQDFSNQESNNRNYEYHNTNKPSTADYYANNRQDNRNNNYNSGHNGGMVNFDSNSYSTNRPSTRNYFASNRQNSKRHNYDDYKVADDSEDIIYWPEA
ncbi:uncharacterized protein LOC106133695 [Amyelois transitella]|uniref:uncharacterized protein LOC106133695 n=1 Tax=Amyelois transitella TaxID=680683 RepID=UPI00067C3994|nr:uncharacterized protein LOC106133695 [Amyelois transitella]